MLLSNKEIFITIILGVVLVLFLVIVFIVAILRYKKKVLIDLEDRIVREKHYQEELLKAQLEIQEQTFKTISQELHDNIGQVLTLAKLNLNTLDINVKDKAIDKIDDAKSLISKAIQDIRDLSKTMNTDTIATVGLCNAIKMELNMLEKTGTIKTGFQAIGDSSQINPQVELILFRIVQEAFHNIIKHAKAANIEVLANYSNNQLQLTIRDNGDGFEHTKLSEGNGLQNMQSRCKLIKADFDISSSIGQGTFITISVPLYKKTIAKQDLN